MYKDPLDRSDDAVPNLKSSPHDEGEGDGIGVGFEFGAKPVWLRVGAAPADVEEPHTVVVVVDVRTGVDDVLLLPCPCAPDVLLFDASCSTSSRFLQSDDALVLTLEHDFISCAVDWANDVSPFISAIDVFVFVFSLLAFPQLLRFEGEDAADDDDGWVRHGKSSILSTDDDELLLSHATAPRHAPAFVLFSSSS